MSQLDREQSLTRIQELLSRPGGKQAIRYLLNAAGAIRFAGGAIAGIGSAWSEKEQQAVNQEFKAWADLADDQLNQLGKLIEELQNKPSAAAFAILISEILGNTPAAGESIPVVLNPASREELQPYVVKGWLHLESTGSVCSMGTRCRIGNHVEERKRPWGMGNGFVLTISSWDLPIE
jgi:hypothetical protein